MRASLPRGGGTIPIPRLSGMTGNTIYRGILENQRRWGLVVISAVLTCLGMVATCRTPSLGWITAFFALATLVNGFPEVGQRLSRSLGGQSRGRRQRREQRDRARRAAIEAKISASADGLTLLQGTESRVLVWSEIVTVELWWEENPWGDPPSGPFSDYYWRITSETAGCISMVDSVVNRFILLPALAAHLPCYSFNYESFRPGDTLEGTCVCWSRLRREVAS